MPGSPQIEVEVVHAMPDRAVIQSYRISSGTRVEELVRLARTDPAFADIAGAATVGLHGRVAPLTQVLEEGDRLEFYRPLAADPKQARRARARSARPRR
jgi:putative ubiquitin-RnfH superfamily antitoxin RatB of RatAB toxin-antitoxin module